MATPCSRRTPSRRPCQVMGSYAPKRDGRPPSGQPMSPPERSAPLTPCMRTRGSPPRTWRSRPAHDVQPSRAKPSARTVSGPSMEGFAHHHAERRQIDQRHVDAGTSSPRGVTAYGTTGGSAWDARTAPGGYRIGTRRYIHDRPPIDARGSRRHPAARAAHVRRFVRDRRAELDAGACKPGTRAIVSPEAHQASVARPREGRPVSSEAGLAAGDRVGGSGFATRSPPAQVDAVAGRQRMPHGRR
jgi:hypothetical protein